MALSPLPKVSRRGAGAPRQTGVQLRRAAVAVLVLLVPVLAGCTNPFAPPAPTPGYTDLPGYVRDPTGRNATAWPDLSNATLTLLDNGAFSWTFDDASKQFTQLTGIKVKLEDGTDTLASLQKLESSRRSGKYDLIWGVDNMVYQKAVRNGDLVAYMPRLADRIDPRLVFFQPATNATWYATPADHGYIGLNVDGNSHAFNTTVDSLTKVRLYADQFVTEDPSTSSPGLGFLLITIAAFGENPPYSPNAKYDWKAYWTDLFRGPDRNHDDKSDGCVQVESTWKLAYEQHFSAGYGLQYGGQGDKPIVTSYAESPAYEAANGMDQFAIATPIVANGTTYHQIQTIAIANGTKNLQAAQAWVEFTLTDYFQELTSSKDAMYPAVPATNASKFYKGLDPTPGSFRAVEFSPQYVADNVERWLSAWRELREDPTKNCKLAG